MPSETNPAGSPPGPPPAPPLRQAPVVRNEASRTSPLTVALELLALAGIGSGLVLALAAGVGPADVVELWIGLVVVLARVVGWWFRTYTVTDRELILDEGILQRNHRVVPLSRIQQVELRQQLMARAFGIATVHIETAGEAGGTAVTLRSLELPTAEALRDHLLAEQRRARAGGVGPDDRDGDRGVGRPITPPRPLVRLDAGQLLLAGATSSASVFTIIAALPIAAALAALTVSEISASAGAVAALATAALFAAYAAAAVAAIAGAGALGALVSLWGYELSLADDDLHVAHGLLDRRQHTMPRHRLQHARVTDNPVRRALGTASVRLYSAASPGGGDEQRGFVEVPLVPRAALGDLLEAAMGSGLFRPPSLEPRPAAALRRAVLRRTVLTAGIAAAVAALWWPAGAGVLPVALLGIPWGRAAHRRAGSALDRPVIALAAGVVVHHLELVPAARLQSGRTTSNPLQRRAALATLHLDVAGSRGPLSVGGPSLRDVGAATAAAGMARAAAPA